MDSVLAANGYRTPYGRALTALSLSMLLSSLGTSIANIALPTLALDFSAPFREIQWIVLAYLLAITTSIVAVGRLGDLVGRRRLLLGGIGVFTLGSVLCGAAPWLWLLIAARAVQGLGAAIMMAIALALVGETVPKARTGSAMGLLGTVSAVGTALGPSLGGVLIAGLGWRAIFLVNLPLGLLALWLASRALPSDGRAAKTEGPAFDTRGMLLLALTLAAYALAMTVSLALLLPALLGLALFLVREARAPSPLVRLGLFRDPMLRAGFATSVLVMAVVMATLVVGPFYLSGMLGLDTARVGLVVSAGPLVVALAGVPAGRMTDRFGAQPMIATGLAAMAAGALLLCALPQACGVAGYVGPLIILTAGYALFQTANNTAVMADVSPQERGLVSGVLNLSRNLGLITGASAMGAVFARGGMRITFALAAALIVLALAISRISIATPKPGRP